MVKKQTENKPKKAKKSTRPLSKPKLVLKPNKRNKSKNGPPVPLFEDFLDLRTLKRHAVNNEYIEKVAEHLVQWATKNEDALLINQFYLENGICRQTIDNWAKRVPKILDALSVAKRAIGLRRELGALKREFSEGMVKNSLPFYGESWKGSEDYKKLEEWRAELRKAIEEAKGDVRVIMESYLEPKKANKKQG